MTRLGSDSSAFSNCAGDYAALRLIPRRRLIRSWFYFRARAASQRPRVDLSGVNQLRQISRRGDRGVLHRHSLRWDGRRILRAYACRLDHVRRDEGVA